MELKNAYRLRFLGDCPPNLFDLNAACREAKWLSDRYHTRVEVINADTLDCILTEPTDEEIR